MTQQASDDVTVRFARPSDGERCNVFYNQYYKRQRTIEQWRWEFCRQVLDDGTIPFAMAEHGGEVVGTQALIPIELIDGTGTYWSAKSEETLVASSMRGRGLFRRLYEPLMRLARERRLESIWGFTPATSAFLKEGFTAPARTSQLVRAFNNKALGALLSSTQPDERNRLRYDIASRLLATYGTVVGAFGARRSFLDLRDLDTAPAWADELSNAFIRQWGGTTIHRSQEYMQWRLFENPFRRCLVVAAFRDQKPVGWIAFGIGSTGVAAVVDVFVAPPDPAEAGAIVQALVGEATRRSRDMGASAIRAWHVSEHPFSRVIRRAVARLGWVHARRGFEMVLKQTPAIQPRPESATMDQWYVSRVYTEGSDI